MGEGPADRVGGPWPKLSRTAAVALSGDRDDDEVGVLLLTDIREAFTGKGIDVISTEDLVGELVSFEEHPWASYNYKAAKDEKHITSRQLARLLKPFGVTSKNIKRTPRVFKGYRLEDFADPFERYLPAPTPHLSATPTKNPPKQQKDGGLAVADASATVPPKSADPLPLSDKNSATYGKGSGVADKNAESGGSGIDPADCPHCGKDSCPGDCCPAPAAPKAGEDDCPVCGRDVCDGTCPPRRAGKEWEEL